MRQSNHEQDAIQEKRQKEMVMNKTEPIKIDEDVLIKSPVYFLMKNKNND